MLSSPWQKPFKGMQINKSHPLARGLVGCWVMNEGTGNKIFDMSGNENSGTNYGTDWVDNGLKFVAGDSDYVVLSNNPNITNDLTIHVSIEPTDFIANNTPHIFCSYGPFPSYPGWGLVLSDPSSGIGTTKNQFAFFDTNAWRLSSTGLIYADNKYILSAVHTSTATKLYFNGNLNTTTGSGAISSYSGKQRIGSRTYNAGWDYYYRGKIFYVMVYARALSSEEIAWLYREPYAMFQSEIEPSLLYFEAPTGWTGKMNTITNPAKINGVAVADITSVMGQ